jgi:hypothetical protein
MTGCRSVTGARTPVMTDIEQQPTPAAWVAVTSDPIVERFTTDQLHHESGGGSRLFNAEKRGDVATGVDSRRRPSRQSAGRGRPAVNRRKGKR